MAKLNRERAVRERRMIKKAKKEARKNAPADTEWLASATPTDGDEGIGLPGVPADDITPSVKSADATTDA